MRRNLFFAMIFAGSALLGTQIQSQPAVDEANRKLASYGLPAITTIHQVRANCHNAYDKLFAENAKGRKPSSEEVNWAASYEAARGAKQPCPKPPASLAARANLHVIETEQGMSAVAGFAQQKDPVALFEAGLAFFNGKFGQKEVQEGYNLISQASDAGDPEAMYNKGVMLVQGQIDNKPDYKNGAALIEKAAASGHVDAMFAAGNLYMRGKEVPKDLKKAFEWYRKAAERGHIYGTFLAWNMINEGQGTRKDWNLAYRLGRRLAEDGQVYGAVMAASALLQSSEPMKHQDEILYWIDYSIRYGNGDVRNQMSALKPKVVEVFRRPAASAGYRPRAFKACPMKTVCTVNHYSGLQSCTTNKDYWNDCDG
ncbi:MAG: tetratricopeptide repeat protein [Novosphingobium sp.]